MSDERPRPRWGEYADPVPIESFPPPVGPEPSEPAAPAEERPHKSRDIIITTALLLLGVWDVVSTWPRYEELGSALKEVFAMQGLSEFSSVELANMTGTWINIARAVILVVAIGFSLLLIARRRLSFWVPLAGAAVAGIMVFILVTSVVLGDPAFMEILEQSRPSGG